MKIYYDERAKLIRKILSSRPPRLIEQAQNYRYYKGTGNGNSAIIDKGTNFF